MLADRCMHATCTNTNASLGNSHGKHNGEGELRVPAATPGPHFCVHACVRGNWLLDELVHTLAHLQKVANKLAIQLKSHTLG